MKRRLLGCLLLALCIVLSVATAVSADNTTTISGRVPLVTDEVSASDIRYVTATIYWKTNAPATSQVFYDTESHEDLEDIADYAYQTRERTALVTEHRVTLTGLRPATKYCFRVRSAIPDTDFVDISDEDAFTTLPPPVVIIPPVPPAPPPVPPGPPPGIPPVLESIAAGGIFIKEVLTEFFNAAGSLLANNLSPFFRSARSTSAGASDD